MEYDYTDFVYYPASGVSGGPFSLAGTAIYIAASPGTGDCPPVGPQPTTISGQGYSIRIVPTTTQVNATISVPGYVNPKYIVLGVIYAPPGSSSFVSYANSDLVSSTTTTKASFSSGYSEGATQLIYGTTSIKGFQGGKVDASAQQSTSYSNSSTSTDSTAVTIQKTIGTVLKANGPLCNYTGVDHDYDVIEVWLNPVVLYTLTNSGVVIPDGYGYSSLDQPGMDVQYVYAGELNGDLTLTSAHQTAFARTWASNEQWPSGQGPGLTAANEQDILDMDPYFNCTWKSGVTDSACPEPPDKGRFTQTTNLDFPYSQPQVGGQPLTKGYTLNYANTNSYGSSETLQNSQTIAYESSVGFSIFGIGFKDTLSKSQTMQWSYETTSQFTNTTTSTSTASITGPACNIVNGECSPVYPPPNAYDPVSCSTATQLPTAFGQGTDIYIYQDNLYGTFMFEPYGQ